jgi:hypothetical protein
MCQTGPEMNEGRAVSTADACSSDCLAREHSLVITWPTGIDIQHAVLSCRLSVLKDHAFAGEVLIDAKVYIAP